MFSVADTIVAIATPPGRGGIGVVRLSGPEAARVASAILTHRPALAPRYATLCRTRLPESSGVSDKVVATFFPSPQSYTGDDVVEISAHGSPVILEFIVSGAMAAGARLARPGEFTLRAFLNGKIDLVQAEAVADLIAAATPMQARTACDQLQGTLTVRVAAIDRRLFDLIAQVEASLDFPDEGYHFLAASELVERLSAIHGDLDALLADARRGRLVRDGATVVIAGRPNVGKSSVYNVLISTDRAIVTPAPGTTRDLLCERLEVGGLAVTLVDTAGDRDAADLIEREGVRRAGMAREVADLVLVVVDSSVPLTADDDRVLRATEGRTRIIVANKRDLPSAFPASSLGAIAVSCETGEGVAGLRDALVGALTGRESLEETPALSNARHIELMARARGHLGCAIQAATDGMPEEFVATDLAGARLCFDEVVGRRTEEDVLRHIFDRFCIGK